MLLNLVQLKGTHFTGTPDTNAGSVKLLHQVIPIWVREDGDTCEPQKPNSRFKGNFKSGEFAIPFSFTFPTHVEISSLAGMIVREGVWTPVSLGSRQGQVQQIHPFPLYLDAGGFPLEKGREQVRPSQVSRGESHITPWMLPPPENWRETIQPHTPTSGKSHVTASKVYNAKTSPMPSPRRELVAPAQNASADSLITPFNAGSCDALPLPSPPPSSGITPYTLTSSSERIHSTAHPTSGKSHVTASKVYNAKTSPMPSPRRELVAPAQNASADSPIRPPAQQ